MNTNQTHLKTNIEILEINLWRKWRRNDTDDVYSFIPGQYDNDKFKDFNTGLLVTNGRTFRIGFKVFEENSKNKLQIVDEVLEIKSIDGKSKPAKMILIGPQNNEIQFTEEI